MNDAVIERERKRLSFLARAVGIGKGVEDVGGLVEVDEAIEVICAANQTGADGTGGSNWLVVATDRRLLLVLLGAGGRAKDHVAVDYAALPTFEADPGRGTLEVRADAVALSLSHANKDQLRDLEAAVGGRR